MKSFNDKTGTLFHYSRTPLNRWFLAIYLFFVLWVGCSIRETSLQVEIPYYRCYVFVRTLMERLKRNIVRNASVLSGKVESDEFYVKSGLKGRSYHTQIIELGRAPRKRSLKSWIGRGTFEKEHPMIVCLHQREGSITSFEVPTRKKGPIIQTIARKVKQGSIMYTDDFEAYARALPIRGYNHEFVNHSEGEYARGEAHVNNCECAANLYRMWIRKFMGVNKNNLEAYSKACELVINSRAKGMSKEERFMQILSFFWELAETFTGIRAKYIFLLIPIGLRKARSSFWASL
jgi:transposase-like protein